ncbi:MAG: hypothetical protein RMH77_04980 [Sulfolobales archaeon]|nr:hypothetical protein [Sulfolobales archaeon]MCX8186691.1 hypothetical protein [Sulfolobales archaeon]MDW7969737.1 hypothetical protein [Sulfolobales archaeon]
MHKEFKLSVVEIARALKITPSAVSRYLNLERGYVINISNNEEITKELKSLAMDVMSGNLGRSEVDLRILKIAIKALRRKWICSYHRRFYPRDLTPNCSICSEIFCEL